MNRVSSVDAAYQIGDLSVFPQALDDKNSLYIAKNNAKTTLKQTLTYNGKNIVVDDASAFPPYGLIRLSTETGTNDNPELIYYGARTNTTFTSLQRAFAGSTQGVWQSSITSVSNAVMAEYHNAIKDAIYNIENDLGIAVSPSPTSLNGILTALENRYLSPAPSFSAYPLNAVPNFPIRFQNFSGNAVRFLWDFGDGTTSVERNPIHQYTQEGTYSVQLNLVSAEGAQGICVKSNYITVSAENNTPFFYVQPQDTMSPNYSIQSAGSGAQVFNFVDQSEGDIIQRYWVFDDGQNESQTDPDVHFTTHRYQHPGTYNPSLLLILSTQKLKRVFLSGSIVVI